VGPVCSPAQTSIHHTKGTRTSCAHLATSCHPHSRTAQTSAAPTMTSALSKRQQARNEKVLQDLVQSVAGNNFCADCQARNPGQSPSQTCSVDRRGLTKSRCQVGHHGVYARPFDPPHPNPEPRTARPRFLHARTRMLTLIWGIAVGHLLVHAVRHDPPQVGHPRVQGQVAEHG